MRTPSVRKRDKDSESAKSEFVAPDPRTRIHSTYAAVVVLYCTAVHYINVYAIAPVQYMSTVYVQYLVHDSNDDLSRTPFLYAEFVCRYTYSSMNIDCRLPVHVNR